MRVWDSSVFIDSECGAGSLLLVGLVLRGPLRKGCLFIC